MRLVLIPIILAVAAALSIPAVAADKVLPLAGEFVAVPAGCFSTNGAKVCLDAFQIGKYEVTQGMWEKVMEYNHSGFPTCEDCPVEQVSFADVESFISRLNGLTGKHYRLPTEAEWEYACRSGGKDETYCGGNDPALLAWFGDNSDDRTHPVGSKKPNGLGIYDMSGNVWEWVSDWYGGKYPSGEKNPTGPPSGTHRVIRGGGWYNGDTDMKAATRRTNLPNNSHHSLGFRLASPVR